jgi:hypothetical protein
LAIRNVTDRDRDAVEVADPLGLLAGEALALLGTQRFPPPLHLVRVGDLFRDGRRRRVRRGLWRPGFGERRGGRLVNRVECGEQRLEQSGVCRCQCGCHESATARGAHRAVIADQAAQRRRLACGAEELRPKRRQLFTAPVLRRLHGSKPHLQLELPLQVLLGAQDRGLGRVALPARD